MTMTVPDHEVRRLDNEIRRLAIEILALAQDVEAKRRTLTELQRARDALLIHRAEVTDDASDGPQDDSAAIGS